MRYLALLVLLYSIQFAEEEYVIDLKYNSQEDCNVHLAVYNGELNFLSQDKADMGIYLEKGQKEVQIRVPSHVKEIAIAAYHDCNQNKIFDLNFIGIPKESYAITNDCRAKWREPTFDEAKIDPSKHQKIEFTLEYWKNR